MPLFPDVPLAAVLDVIQGAVMTLFVLSALLVILVVLLQEGKGGGLAGAFGGAGAETFGVKAGTVNKFTAWLAAAFLGLALLHAGLSTATETPLAPLDTREFDAAGETPAPPDDVDRPGDAEAPGDTEKPGDAGSGDEEKPGDAGSGDDEKPADDGN